MGEQGIAELSQGMYGLRMLVGVEDIIKDKAGYNSLNALWVDLPLPEGEVLIKEAIKVPIS